MAEKIRVMIVDDIAETREQLRKLLSFDPDVEVIAMVGSGEEAVATVVQAHPDVILMDINLPGMDGITATGKVVEAIPTVQVIMLSVQGETDYMRRAMMAGARDYLTKPPSADDLLDAIHRAFKLRQKMGTGPLNTAVVSGGTPGRAAVMERQAKVITVFSPKGGTGCTTMVVNLAVALQAMVGPDVNVCVVDANLQFGDISVFMKLQPTRTLADLAPHVQDLDADLLKTITVPHSSGVQVLVAPASPEEADVFRDAGTEETGVNHAMRTILEFAQLQYDYIIVDTSHHVDDVLLAALDVSDLVLVVTRPVIPEIRGARMFVELLQKLGYAMNRIGLVINCVENKRMGIQPEAIERAMMPALAQIPLDERIALRAANYGEPILPKNARTPLGMALIAFAKKVREQFLEKAPEEVAPTDGQKRAAGLGRLL
ncbi:MAG: response regulator [Anaerolineae bacterium]|nr:response regulator [Anaerolineae bacterium]